MARTCEYLLLLDQVAAYDTASCSDVPKYEFPGWVPPTELKLETLEAVDKKSLHHPSRGVLGEIYATAIAGNDVTSSVLYIVGVTSTLAGQLSPICMLLAGCVLYLFKAIIGEVGVGGDSVFHSRFLTGRVRDSSEWRRVQSSS